MVSEMTAHERRKLLRLRLRLLAVLAVEAVVIPWIVSTVGGWSVLALAVLAGLTTLCAWIIWGTVPGGWFQASLATFALKMLGGAGIALALGSAGPGLLIGTAYGALWALVTLVPVAIVSLLLRRPA